MHLHHFCGEKSIHFQQIVKEFFESCFVIGRNSVGFLAQVGCKRKQLNQEFFAYFFVFDETLTPCLDEILCEKRTV